MSPGPPFRWAASLKIPTCAAQSNTNQIAGWFPKDQLITIGVYYYPEAWPESQWERDIANIKKFGFEYIHLAEFAWAFMEPTEGNYQFRWLDKVIAIAQRNGLKVVLCTPSATPPVWLSKAHPEILMISAEGRRMEHGSREQADWSSPVYRQYVEKIDAKMAEHYGANPAVWGWQLDNELSHYGQGISYALPSQLKFRARGCAKSTGPSSALTPIGATPSGRRCITTSTRSTCRISATWSRV